MHHLKEEGYRHPCTTVEGNLAGSEVIGRDPEKVKETKSGEME